MGNRTSSFYVVAVRRSARGRIRADIVTEIPDVTMKSPKDATRVLVQATEQAISMARDRFGKQLIIEPQFDYVVG
jgi:hypothetical protein